MLFSNLSFEIKRGNEKMGVLKTLWKLFIGFWIFALIYAAISGNGNDTAFMWIQMFISLVLTIAFLDEDKNKKILVFVIVMFTIIRFNGPDSGIPRFLITLGLTMILFGGKRTKNDTSESEEDSVRNERESFCWHAYNIYNPFERYFYDEQAQSLVINKGIISLMGKSSAYPVSIFAGAGYWEVSIHGIVCDIVIPVKFAVGAENITIKNISRKKVRELDHIINGKQTILRRNMRHI